jgi:septal ring factor EnvC (AmiA/AmiB activator)
MVLTIVSIVLGLGAIGAWLLTAGKRMAQNEQTKKDVDGIGRKVEAIRRELKEDVHAIKMEQKELDNKVDEIAKMTVENNVLLSKMNESLNRLLDAHTAVTGGVAH